MQPCQMDRHASKDFVVGVFVAQDVTLISDTTMLHLINVFVNMPDK